MDHLLTNIEFEFYGHRTKRGHIGTHLGFSYNKDYKRGKFGCAIVQLPISNTSPVYLENTPLNDSQEHRAIRNQLVSAFYNYFHRDDYLYMASSKLAERVNHIERVLDTNNRHFYVAFTDNRSVLMDEVAKLDFYTHKNMLEVNQDIYDFQRVALINKATTQFFDLLRNDLSDYLIYITFTKAKDKSLATFSGNQLRNLFIEETKTFVESIFYRYEPCHQYGKVAKSFLNAHTNDIRMIAESSAQDLIKQFP